MKNRLTTFVLFLAILATPLAAHAQNKIGVININAAIASTAEGKKAIADLQKKYQPRQQELERLQKEIQGIQDQLSKPTPALSDEEQRRLSRDLEDKQKLLKRSLPTMRRVISTPTGMTPSAGSAKRWFASSAITPHKMVSSWLSMRPRFPFIMP